MGVAGSAPATPPGWGEGEEWADFLEQGVLDRPDMWEPEEDEDDGD